MLHSYIQPALIMDPDASNGNGGPTTLVKLYQKFDCPICLDDIIQNHTDTVVVQCCNNTFHSTCHAKCIAVHNRCPLCRKEESIETKQLECTTRRTQSIIAFTYTNIWHCKICTEHKRKCQLVMLAAACITVAVSTYYIIVANLTTHELCAEDDTTALCTV
jgi:hypothetical protein